MNEGQPSAYLAAKVQETGGFGTLMQSIDSAKYAGKRVRLRAMVHSKNVADWAGVWMRVDSGEKMVAFDNMQRRAIRGDQTWRTYDVVLNVPQNATGISFGILLSGSGEVWMNGLNFEVVGDDVAAIDSTDATRSVPSTPVNLNFQR